MQFRRALERTLLGLICALIIAPSAPAQLKRKLERCLPYPTPGEEIADTQAEVEAKKWLAANVGKPPAEEPEAPDRKVIIDDVQFVPPVSVPKSTLEEIVADIKERPLNPYGFAASPSQLSDFEEVAVRGAFQDRGYFKFTGTAEIHPIRSEGPIDHVAVILHVETGPQYRLGKLRFRTNDPEETLAFSEDELRKLIPLQAGDIFSAEKIRQGLEAMRSLYGSKGYIDFTPEPQTEIDDANQLINLTMVLSQQKQYRIRKVDVFGPNQKMEDLLKSEIKVGDVYDSQKLQRILDENKSELPPDFSSQDIELHKNVKDGTVDVRLDLQTCPEVAE